MPSSMSGWLDNVIFPPHGALLPRHLEAISPFHGRATAAAGGSTALSRPYRRRGIGLSGSQREGTQRVHWHAQLPSGGVTELLLLRRGPGTVGSWAMRGGITDSHQEGARRLICYLESAEVTAILAEPDRKTLDGQRDHALLALLYNTSRRLWICARRRFGWNLHANLKKPEMCAKFGSHGQPREPLGCGFDCDQPPQRHMAPKRIWCL